ncbi:hypothetical protein ACFYNW_12130 [Streptomyces virginiae]|uniref:hypothetical protein n=1 Tax=Streptomyces virginiae TaxID=1961 RepID=UPI0036E937AF
MRSTRRTPRRTTLRTAAVVVGAATVLALPVGSAGSGSGSGSGVVASAGAAGPGFAVLTGREPGGGRG